MQEAFIYVLTSPLDALVNACGMTQTLIGLSIACGISFTLAMVSIYRKRHVLYPWLAETIDGEEEEEGEEVCGMGEDMYLDEDEGSDLDDRDPVTILDTRNGIVVAKEDLAAACVVHIRIPGMEAVYDNATSINDKETHRVYACRPFSAFQERKEAGKKKRCDIGSVISKYATLWGELKVETHPDLFNRLKKDSRVLVNLCMSEWIVTTETQDPWGKPKLVETIDRSYDLMLEEMRRRRRRRREQFPGTKTNKT
jgi:hypothetical protein